LDHLYNLIIKEIDENNNFLILEELLIIDNLDIYKLLDFSKKQEKEIKNIKLIIKSFSNKIDNYLANLDIYIDFQTTFFYI
jgi:hypothetical protein